MLLPIVLVTSSIIGLWLAVELLDRPQLLAPILISATVAVALGIDVAAALGSIRVTAFDVIIVLVLTAGVIGVALGRIRLEPATWPWLLMLALLAVGVVRGVAGFGPEPAVNATRLLGGFLVPAAFVAVQRQHVARIAAWTRASLFAGAVVLGVAALWFLARNGLSTFGTDGRRALDSLGALLVAQAGLLAAANRSWPPWLRTTCAAAAAAVLVAAQVRTVAVAAVAGVLVLAVTSARGKRMQAVAGVGLGVVALLVVAGSMSGLSQSLRYASSEPFQKGSTFEWRTRGWVELVDAQLDDSTIDLVIGDPAGEGTTRRIRIDGIAREVTFSAHSQWVTTLLALGVVGLVTWTGLVAWIAWRSARFRIPELSGWYAAGATAIVFSITYQLGPEQGLVIGLLASTAALGRAWAGPARDRGSEPEDAVPAAPGSTLADAR